MSDPIEKLHPDTRIGAVFLTVKSLDESLVFYRLMGLQVHRREGRQAALGAGGEDLVVLEEDPGAQPPGRTAGLYHFAVRVPSRLELARAIQRLARGGWRFQGFSDHAVSEAAYLADPDGNGIEIYRDYPRDQWPVLNDKIQMTTEPMDLDGVMAELKREPSPADEMDSGTDMGHIHLKVSNIPASEAFYTQVLGFDLVTRYGHSASFVSAGGYHHHVGMNTWESAGAQSAPEGCLGLRYYTILLPTLAEMEKLVRRLNAAAHPWQESSEGIFITDPSGIRALFSVV